MPMEQVPVNRVCACSIAERYRCASWNTDRKTIGPETGGGWLFPVCLGRSIPTIPLFRVWHACRWCFLPSLRQRSAQWPIDIGEWWTSFGRRMILHAGWGSVCVLIGWTVWTILPAGWFLPGGSARRCGVFYHKCPKGNFVCSCEGFAVGNSFLYPYRDLPVRWWVR